MDETRQLDSGINFSGPAATPRPLAQLAQRIDVARQLLAKGLDCVVASADEASGLALDEAMFRSRLRIIQNGNPQVPVVVGFPIFLLNAFRGCVRLGLMWLL